MLGFLAPILGSVASGIFKGNSKLNIAQNALETAGDFFTSSNRERMEELRIEYEEVRQAGELAREQARHPSLFVSGARPALTWISAGAAAYHFIFFPLFDGLASKFNYNLVDLDWQELSILLGLALGMGGLRSYEKMKGVARTNMKG